MPVRYRISLSGLRLADSIHALSAHLQDFRYRPQAEHCMHISAYPPRCPLYPQCAVQLGISALGQKRTHAAQQKVRYSITSSARPSSGGGTVMPRALAVFRFRNI
jgi:hypothetical protein